MLDAVAGQLASRPITDGTLLMTVLDDVERNFHMSMLQYAVLVALLILLQIVGAVLAGVFHNKVV